MGSALGIFFNKKEDDNDDDDEEDEEEEEDKSKNFLKVKRRLSWKKILAAVTLFYSTKEGTKQPCSEKHMVHENSNM